MEYENIKFADLLLRYREKYGKTHRESTKEFHQVLSVVIEEIEDLVAESDKEKIGELGRISLPNLGKLHVVRHKERKINTVFTNGETAKKYSPPSVNLLLVKSSQLNI